MRLPYIQVDADFLGSGAGDLAELLRISEAEAGWAMCRLWAWAVSKAANPEALGLLEDEDMERLAERAAGWKGEAGAFLAALQRPAVGLAQREESGAVRLLGMDRYASTFRRLEADRARKAGGLRKDVARNSSGTPAELQRKTQTQTQTQINPLAGELPAAAGQPQGEEDAEVAAAVERLAEQPQLELVAQPPPKASSRPQAAREARAPKTPREPASSDLERAAKLELERVYAAEREGRVLPWDGGGWEHLRKALSAAGCQREGRQRVDSGPEGVVELLGQRFRLGLQRAAMGKFPGVSTVAQLAPRWADLESAALAQGRPTGVARGVYAPSDASAPDYYDYTPLPDANGWAGRRGNT